MIRENLVLTDFTGISRSRASGSRHEQSTIFAVVQAFNLVVLARFNRVALFRILALRQKLGVYKRKAKKPRLRTNRSPVGQGGPAYLSLGESYAGVIMYA